MKRKLTKSGRYSFATDAEARAFACRCIMAGNEQVAVYEADGRYMVEYK